MSFQFGFRIVRFVLIFILLSRLEIYVIGRIDEVGNMVQRSKQGVGILRSMCLWIQIRNRRKFTLALVIDHSEDGAGWRLMDEIYKMKVI